jgi:hypothetical protein
MIHPSAKLCRQRSVEVTVVRWASVLGAVRAGRCSADEEPDAESDPTLCVAWDAYIFLRKSYQ